ncbi:Microcystin-dependent protein [Nocardioides exalbidus]|uniref:Microcystin-dependent protein n=1 Tax=Nocardioides exalbidus TaxID=402596 RepID=A0A1H4KA63_9ACTN|nr:tail fiber protein [Nocardioides exalbidus]SEB54938.1 Microcystin-dependent protein [Nocardioides exalbidus]
MLEPFLGEIQWVSFNFPPKGWAFCNGQLLPINQNQALFSLLGTMYGGNGQTNFALPNLQGRVIVGAGSHVLGQTGGEEAHALTQAEMPRHSHGYAVSDHRGTTGDPGAPSGTAFASGETVYTAPSASNGTFHPATVGNVGGSQPHTNLQPYLTLNAIIALVGIFPSQN